MHCKQLGSKDCSSAFCLPFSLVSSTVTLYSKRRFLQRHAPTYSYCDKIWIEQEKKAERGFFMNNVMFYIWIFGIAIIAFLTGEIATVMMLFLILLTLQAIHSTIKDFYEDWKSRNH